MTDLELSLMDIEKVLNRFCPKKREVYRAIVMNMDDLEFLELRKFQGVCQYTYYNKTGLTGHHGKWIDLINEPHYLEEINLFGSIAKQKGNVPHHYMNDGMWRRFKDNINYCEAWMSWMFGQNNLAEYRTEWGNVYMLQDKVAHANINLKYRGLTYILEIWNEYPGVDNHVDLIHITGSTNPGFTFYGTKGCEERHAILSQRRKEIDKDTVEKILRPTEDMGYSLIKAIEYARKELL